MFTLLILPWGQASTWFSQSMPKWLNGIAGLGAAMPTGIRSHRPHQIDVVGVATGDEIVNMQIAGINEMFLGEEFLFNQGLIDGRQGDKIRFVSPPLSGFRVSIFGSSFAGF
ncbi:MAG: hypothetical protein R2911_11720 [Caldilineaceae bacterium]